MHVFGQGDDTKDMDLQPKLFVDVDLEDTCITKATIIRHKSELSEVVFGETAFDVHDGSVASLCFCRVPFHCDRSLRLASHGPHRRRSNAIVRFANLRK